MKAGFAMRIAAGNGLWDRPVDESLEEVGEGALRGCFGKTKEYHRAFSLQRFPFFCLSEDYAWCLPMQISDPKAGVRRGIRTRQGRGWEVDWMHGPICAPFTDAWAQRRDSRADRQDASQTHLNLPPSALPRGLRGNGWWSGF